VTREPAPDRQAARASAAQAEQAFRDQPVNRGPIEKAVAEFRRIAAASGIQGAAAYSEQCFNLQSRTRAVADFDHCVAFDHLASRGDLIEGSRSGLQFARFQPQPLVTRHIRAAELIARDPSLIEARLFEIRRLADNEISRIATAASVQRLSGRPAARPLARAAVQRAPAARRPRAEPVRPQRPNTNRPPSEQDFLEREGGIY
jgi:hypothetical protein